MAILSQRKQVSTPGVEEGVRGRRGRRQDHRVDDGGQHRHPGPIDGDHPG